MNINTTVYPVKEAIKVENITYLFVSRGYKEKIKVVEFEYAGIFGDRHVYNLGFGDYNAEKDSIEDGINTNNGDVYQVFNTVLSIIPRFFRIYEDAALMVEGSDSRIDFVQKCRLNCRKKCEENCRDYERRMNVYRNYVNKNFKTLCKTYTFWGGIQCENGKIIEELYQPGKKYDIVYVSRKRKFEL